MSRYLVFALILSLVAPNTSSWAQSATKKTTTTKKSATSTRKKSTTAKKKVASKSRKHPSRKVRLSPARLRRLNKAFVASAELKPMAQQLVAYRTKDAYGGVEAYAKKHAGTDEAALAWLAIGYAHLLDKEYPEAEAALKKAKPHAGELSDYVRYLLALAYGGQGNNEEVVATLKRFAEESPESIFVDDVVDIYGNALVATGHAAEAVEFLQENRTPTRASVELALGRAYVKAGQPEKGLETLRHLYYTMPASDQADSAALDLKQLELQLSAAPVPYSLKKTRATALMRASHFSDAAKELQALLGEAGDADRAEIQVALGTALRRSGNLKDAKRVLDSVEVSDDLKAQRYYNLLEIARSQDDEAAVEDNLTKLRQESPVSGWLASALLSVGNMYLLDKNYDRAAEAYRELATRFPKDSRASYTHWKAAWLDYRQGRRDLAKQAFENQVTQFPNGNEVSAALYWRGRIAEDEKDFATAKAWYAKLADRYRNYYYGYLARERLSKLGDLADIVDDPILERVSAGRAFSQDAMETKLPTGDLRVEKSRLLQNAGLAEFAVKELIAAEGGSRPNWATIQIARVYSDAGMNYRALQSLKRAVPGYYSVALATLPREYWEYLFPKPFWTDLKANSLANGLDPHFVASLIRQESEFNPGAISRANALGLMQLLPSVGRGEARELKMRGFVPEQLLSPNVNIKLGTRYLKEMIDRYNGQLEYALAAYNAGTNRVDDWLASGKFRDMPEFVESIPFTETREYVQAIMRNAEVYRRLYPN